jgi:Immunoglobulin I-set domain
MLQFAFFVLLIGNGKLPRLTISPSRFTTHVGGEVTFRCQVSVNRGQVNGNGASSTVSWQRADGRPLSSRAIVSGNALIFRRVESTDGGRYICLVSNRYGQSREEAELTVSGRVFTNIWFSYEMMCCD